MNCSPNISIALSLLALTAGVWFLYKTQKENLGILYKIAAWFVIIVSLLNMACCGLRCCMHGCKMREECRMEQMYGGECDMQMMHERHCMMMGGMNHCGMGMMQGCDKERGECSEGKGECNEANDGKCSDMEKGKCQDMGKDGKCKMGMKKDSVVVVVKKK